MEPSPKQRKTQASFGSLEWLDATVVAAYLIKNGSKPSFTSKNLADTIRAQKLVSSQMEFKHIPGYIQHIIKQHDKRTETRLLGQGNPPLFDRQKKKTIWEYSADYHRLDSYLESKYSSWCKEQVEAIKKLLVKEDTPIQHSGSFYNKSSIYNFLVPTTIDQKKINYVSLRRRNIEQQRINDAIEGISKFLSQSRSRNMNLFSNPEEKVIVERLIRPTEFISKKLQDFQKLRYDEDDIRIALLGSRKAGKSMFLNCFFSNIYPQQYSENYCENVQDHNKSFDETKVATLILNRHTLVADYSHKYKEELDPSFIAQGRNSEWYDTFYSSEYTTFLEQDKKYRELLNKIYNEGTTFTAGSDAAAILENGSFLLPSRSGTTSTTAFPIITKNGIIPSMRVVYFSKAESKHPTIAAALKEIKYKTALDKIGAKETIYFAKGENPNLDRIYIKSLLKRIFEDEALSIAIKEVIIYLPLELLGKNTALIDVAGTNDLDEFKKYHLDYALNSASQLFVILDVNYQLAEDVHRVIFDSEFFKRMISHPMKYSMHFITMVEKTGVAVDTLAKKVTEAQESVNATKVQFMSALRSYYKNGEYSEKTYDTIQFYYCFPLLFCSLTHAAKEHLLQATFSEEQIRNMISQTNMMELYTKIYQLMYHYLLSPMQLLNDCYFDILSQFYAATSLEWNPDPTIQCKEPPQYKFEFPTEKFKKLTRQKLLSCYQQYINNYLDQYMKIEYDDAHINNCDLLRDGKSFDGPLLDVELKLSEKEQNDFISNLKYDVVSTISNKIMRSFEKYLYRVLDIEKKENSGELMMIIASNFKVFSIYIQVFLQSKFDSDNSLLTLPTCFEIIRIFTKKVKKYDPSATAASSMLHVSNDLKKLVTEHFKNQFLENLSGPCRQYVDTICLAIKELITANIKNTSSLLVLPKQFLGIDAKIIEDMKVSLEAEKDLFLKYYGQFNTSLETLCSWSYQTSRDSDKRRSTDSMLKQKHAMMLEIATQKFVFPIVANFAGESVCYEYCEEGHGGEFLRCSLCEQWFHYSCYKQVTPEDVKTFEEYSKDNVSFCCGCNGNIRIIDEQEEQGSIYDDDIEYEEQDLLDDDDNEYEPTDDDKFVNTNINVQTRKRKRTLTSKIV